VNNKAETRPWFWASAVALFFAMAYDLYLVFRVAPTEVTMGEVYRIFYFHVPSAWVALVSFFVVFVSSVMYLVKRTRFWDLLAVSSAELGVVFIAIVLITGPIWAKSAWGIWWTWDPRLTSTLVLFLLFVGYLMLRSYVPEPTTRAKLSAVVGIVSFVDVPIVYFAIDWWRNQHPSRIIGAPAGKGFLSPEMKPIFWFSVALFVAFYAILLVQRFRLAQAGERLEGLRRKVRSRMSSRGSRPVPTAGLAVLLLMGGSLFVPNRHAMAQGQPSDGQVSPTQQLSNDELRAQLDKQRDEIEQEKARLDLKERDLERKIEANDTRLEHLFLGYVAIWVVLFL